MSLNLSPNSERDWIRQYPSLNDTEKARRYPLFFCGITFDVFRHMKNIEMEFISPISVISGTNKSGKTTALMAIACSHHNFQRRRVSNGDLERNTWGDVMRFTDHDVQQEDWVYHVRFRRGNSIITQKGSRNHNSRKWSGVAKKQGQIDTPRPGSNQAGRQVTLIDLERLQPARHLPASVFLKAKAAPVSNVDVKIADYLSYILEIDYQIDEICSSADNVIYRFRNTNNQYSSYNSASGEDVLTRLIRDVVDTPNKSLILIEEIEVGLHPKIQRRLMDVLMYESRQTQKQFIVTTHSQTILSCVDPDSRLFIDSQQKKCIKRISTSAALSKMDAIAYPLVNLVVEDNLAKWIVIQAISSVNEKHVGFNHLINIIPIGSAEETYKAFYYLRKLHKSLRPQSGYACILDGDKRNDFSDPDLLFFIFGNEAPERYLVRSYLKKNPNDTLQYHLSSNPHCLFEKMCELSIATDTEDARNKCWNAFLDTVEGQAFLNDLCNFLIGTCLTFSPTL